MDRQNTNLRVYRSKPTGFLEMAVISAFCCVFQKQMLLLKREPNKEAGGSWCLPGGKKEEEESTRSAAVRELKEEAGIYVEEEETRYIGTFYMEFPNWTYSLYLYKKEFEQKPAVEINLIESSEARWVLLEEAKQLPIIHGCYSILEHCSTQ